MDSEEKQHNQHEHENAKHLMYAGLATVTLVGGMGATPVVLAEEIAVEQTETVVKHEAVDDKTTDESSVPTIQTPEALPVVDVIPSQPQREVPDETADTQASQKTISKIVNAGERSGKLGGKVQDKSGMMREYYNPNFGHIGTEPHEFTKEDFNYSNDGKTLHSIKMELFLGGTLLNWDGVVVIPKGLENVTAIGEMAFLMPILNFNIIQKVDLRNLTNLETIERLAFVGGNYIGGSPYTDLPANLTSVDFTGLKKLKSIDESAFYGNSLTHIDFTGLSNLETIGPGAFYGNSLTEVDFTDLNNLKAIEAGAFGSNQISTIDFNQLTNIEKLGGGAFANNDFREVDLSPLKKLTVIEEALFAGNSQLQSVIFPQSNLITAIGNSAFENTALAAIDFSQLPQLKTIGDNAFSKTALEKADMTALTHLQSIGVSAFETSTQLAEVKFPKSTSFTTIGAEAFCETALTEVDFSPSPNLHDIGDFAFAGKCTQPTEYDDFGQLVGNTEYGISKINKITVGKLDTSLSLNFNQNGLTNLMPAGMVVALDNDSLANARAFVAAINTAGQLYEIPETDRIINQPFTGDDAWQIPAKLTYEFVDQNGKPITQDANGQPVGFSAEYYLIDEPYTGKEGPEIAGYGAPTLIEGTLGGTMDLPYKKIVYQYQQNVVPPLEEEDTDKPVVTPKPIDKPVTATKPVPENILTPDEDLSTTDDKLPGDLPESGGEKQPGKAKDAGKANRPAPTTSKTITTSNTEVTEKGLPKSGTRNNAVLPVVGAALLAGIFGAYALIKKRKS